MELHSSQKVLERPKQVMRETTSSKSTSSFFTSLRAPSVSPEDNTTVPTNLQYVELPFLGIQHWETKTQNYHVLLPTLRSSVQMKSEVWGKIKIISITNSIQRLRSTNYHESKTWLQRVTIPNFSFVYVKWGKKKKNRWGKERDLFFFFHFTPHCSIIVEGMNPCTRQCFYYPLYLYQCLRF